MESQNQQSETERQLAENIQANERFAKREYPNEKFISDNAEFQSKNRFTKGLIIPENVKVAESRVPINQEKLSFQLAEEILIFGIRTVSDKKSLPCGRARYPGRN